MPGYESSNWFGAVGPANIAAEIVEQLNREINAGLADLKIVDRIAGSHQPFGLFELGDAGALCTPITYWFSPPISDRLAGIS